MKPRLLLPFLLSLSLQGQEKITYDDHIFPIFEQSCLNCHNPDKKKGDLDLSSYPALMVGGSGGKVAVPGDGGSSQLYTVTTGTEEPVMPPEGDRIDRKSSHLIRAWIDGGMLETKNSTTQKAAKPKFDLTVDSSAGKPEGPPPMPGTLSLDPSFVAPRAGLVRSMTASPWAPLIALTGQKQILLYNSDTLRFLGSLPFPKGQPESLSFHPSGKYLLAGGGIAGKSGQAIAWDITTGKELFTVGREFDSVLATAITPDLGTVALGGPSRLLKIWNTRDNVQTHSIKKHTDWITALAASPDGKFFASGDRNGGVHVWDLNGNEIHALRDHQGGVTALAFRSDSKLLASTGEDGFLIIWDMKNGSVAKKTKAHKLGATALHYHRDGHLVTAGRDRVVKIFKPDFNEKASFKNLPEVITATALSQDGKHLFMADYHGDILVYDVSSSKAPITTLESNPPLLKNRLAYLAKKVEEQTEQVTSAQKTFQAAAKEREEFADQIRGTRDALKKNERIVKNLEERIKHLDTKVKSIATQINKDKHSLNKARSEKQKAIQTQKNLAAQIVKLKADKEKIANLSKQVQETAKKQQQFAREEIALTNKSKNQNKERDRLASNLKSLRRQSGEIRELIKEGRVSLKSLEPKMQPLTKKLAEPKKALDAALAEQERLRKELAYWQNAQ